MAVFKYNALDSGGHEFTGKLQAADEAAAASDLRQRGLRVLEMKKTRSSNGFMGQENFSDWLATQRSVTNASLIFFFRQMSFMLRAGLPVANALNLAQSQVSSPRLKLAIKLMLHDIESGYSLSVAMKKHKDVFPEMAINLVMAGENTGELDVIMERLAVHLEKKAAVRSQTINAMIYPVIVVLAAIGVGVFMVVKIIPQFAGFLQKQGKILPPSTQALIDISAYIRDNGLAIIIVVIAVIAAILVTYQTRLGRLWLDSLLLRVPVIGKMLETGSMAQMTWALSILLRSGVTVLDALKLTAQLIGNRVYSDTLQFGADKILGGRDLSGSIYHRQMPPLVLQMVKIGEETGTLDHVLQELGKYYQDLLEIAIKRLSALIEPAMILVIGSMVGFVYYAFFKALFSLVSGG